ncbi:hypothetical protein N0V84_001886 [Fusarium piperis]|uniref:Aminoglycoside phosphotransferase domain-containing protein n=1 Tax=Fusarium piperis TaxID=1435070 RepID=A0A9W8WK39_9HYPO|nr:hypothetical protein N0V84_001886 [Fusarium piperis]
MDNDIRPKIVGAFSMRKNELQIDGYTAPRSTATTAKEFFAEQYQLLQYMWKMPSHELSQEEAEREEFALHALSLEEAQSTSALQTDSSGDLFCLFHPDLRVNNIIVDDELRICGVIDWEFSVTVPSHVFLPPAWITGHDTGSIISKVDFASEFKSVLLSKKQQSASHSQLVQDWDFQDDFRFVYPKLYKKPRDEIVPRFFHLPENKELLEGLERRLRASERYTQYLKDNDLLDDEEEPEWQQIREWTMETKETLDQLRKWSDETQDNLARLDRERAMHREREKQV